MNSLIFLIPIALGLGAFGLFIFFWAMKSDQFEDLDGAANRILIDEDDLSSVKAKEPKSAETAPETSTDREPTPEEGQ